MPYVDDESRNRDQLTDKIVDLKKSMLHFNDDEIEGVLNYTITSLLDVVMLVSKEKRWRYKYISRVVGVMFCCVLEFYRRLAAPYEDKAIFKNGDVEIYKDLA